MTKARRLSELRKRMERLEATEAAEATDQFKGATDAELLDMAAGIFEDTEAMTELDAGTEDDRALAVMVRSLASNWQRSPDGTWERTEPEPEPNTRARRDYTPIEDPQEPETAPDPEALPEAETAPQPAPMVEHTPMAVDEMPEGARAAMERIYRTATDHELSSMLKRAPGAFNGPTSNGSVEIGTYDSLRHRGGL
jgi:hypothetical protein